MATGSWRLSLISVLKTWKHYIPWNCDHLLIYRAPHLSTHRSWLIHRGSLLMWNSNIHIFSKKYRFRMSVDCWGQIIDIYEKKQRINYWTLTNSIFITSATISYNHSSYGIQTLRVKRPRKRHKRKYHLCSRTGIRAQTFGGQLLLWKKTKINENIHGITIYSCFVFRLLQYNNNIHVVYRHNYSTDISITVKNIIVKICIYCYTMS
jgi:hypothetical protein